MSMANPGQHRIWIFETGRRAAAAGLGLAIVFALTLGATEAVQAQTYQVIHNFTGGVDGAEPTFGLTIDAAGNLYGTTFEGDAGTGTAYKLAHKTTGWALTPLYVFTITSNGVIPYSTLVPGRDGKLYGTTGFGGIGPCLAYGHLGCGTVFTLQNPGTLCHTSYCPWIETPLYKFSGGADGSTPYGATLVFDAAGNLYGTTFGGGSASCTNGCGLVYKLTPAGSGWTESTVYAFTGGADGAAPWAGVTLDQAGNLYGTTSAGGAFGGGTVYELSPSGSGWTKRILHSFQLSQTDGASPFAGLIFDQSGNLYGATQYGGSGGGGTVFELSPSGGNWTFTTLYSFSGSGGGRAKGPVADLVMDSAGNLYGSTAGDGVYRFGSAFKLTHGTGGWTYTSLHDFTNGLDGGSLRSNLVFDSAGNLYGTASTGGTGNPVSCVGSCGVVWQITPH
jgi:uncharacterized repeat protein (TIGR03803 family)